MPPRHAAGVHAAVDDELAARDPGCVVGGEIEAAAGDGIRVNSVHPGIIDTPIWGKIPTGATGAGQNAPIDPEERARLVAPLGRAGQAAEIASGVLYLASDASRYVTGSELVIDGGMNAGGVPRRQ